MVDEYKDRLREAMRDAGVTPQRLADHLGVKLQGVRKVLGGGSAAFNVPNHFKAARFLKVDPLWLATGDGEARSSSVWPFATVTAKQYFVVDPKLQDAAEAVLRSGIEGAPLREDASNSGAHGREAA